MALMVIGLFVSVSMAAFTIDVSYFYLLKSRLQMTADVAALAAAGEFPDEDEVYATALEYAGKNMPTSDHGSVLLNADMVTGNWDSDTRTFTPAGAPLNAVKVVTRRAQANGNAAGTFFARIIGIDNIDIQRTAIAIAGETAPSCVLSLAESGNSMYLNSDSAIEANGCNVQVNSTASDALVTNSGSTATADSICVTGDYEGSGYSPAPDTSCDPEPDPLASLPDPSYGSCDYTDHVVSSGTETLTPGVYCGKLEIQNGATAILDPGIYIMDDALFKANSGGIIQGDDVMIYLTGTDGRLEFNSDSTVTLSARLTGPYAGIVVYQDRNVADGTVHLINSDSNSFLEGVVYLPNGKVMINSGSNFGDNATWSIFIAKEFEINSDSTLVLNTNYEGSTVPLPAGFVGNSSLVM